MNHCHIFEYRSFPRKSIDIRPDPAFVEIYFKQRGRAADEVQSFLAFYNANDWKTATGLPIVNWKKVANDWIWYCRKKNKLQNPISLTPSYRN